VPEAATPALVRLSGVRKRFASVEALARLDLTVADGEFLSILGPSGCGKSTALRIVAGLMAPSEGEIDWPLGSTETGFVFQEATLMPWARVFDNVWLPLRLRGISRRDAQVRVMEVLSLVGLEGFARAYPRELSGGMKMRVSIARALVLRPRLLLMDEPFAALDEITRLKLNDELLRLRAALGCTVLFVTHSVFESVYLSDRVLVMSARPGRVVQELRIEAPSPRSQGFRLGPAYSAWCAEASAALERASGAPA
jgi:NitT/TauT family transport system ATP-binding protein